MFVYLRWQVKSQQVQGDRGRCLVYKRFVGNKGNWVTAHGRLVHHQAQKSYTNQDVHLSTTILSPSQWMWGPTARCWVRIRLGLWMYVRVFSVSFCVVGKPEENGLHAWRKRWWEDNIKMYPSEIWSENIDWVPPARGRFQWRTAVKMVMKFHIPYAVL
jgi:hypothetical protein